MGKIQTEEGIALDELVDAGDHLFGQPLDRGEVELMEVLECVQLHAVRGVCRRALQHRPHGVFQRRYDRIGQAQHHRERMVVDLKKAHHDDKLEQHRKAARRHAGRTLALVQRLCFLLDLALVALILFLDAPQFGL